jgi:hypothetical protein
MTIEDEDESFLPDLPALVVIPTSNFERPERRRRNDPKVPDLARTDILLATASLLALIELVESFFPHKKGDDPTRHSLIQLRGYLEGLEDDIVHDCFDLHPNSSTSELALIVDEADELVKTLPMRTTSAERAALRFFIEEIRRRAIEVFEISVVCINTLDVERAFNAVDKLPYPPT